MNTIRDLTEFYLFLAFVFIFKCLPYKLTLKLLKGLFYIFGFLLGIRKKVVIRQLKLCFPEKTEKEIIDLTKNIYLELATTVAEVFIFDEKYFQGKVELIDFDEVKKALLLGRGVIIVSAHFSNWELGAKLVAKEYSEFYGVVKKMRNKIFDAYLCKKRNDVGIKTIEMKDALKTIISVLKKNNIVAILVDQYAKKQGTAVNFLGHKTKTYTSVAQIAIKYKVPIIMTFDIRDNDGKHKVIFNKPLLCDDIIYNDENILDLTSQINSRIEEKIKEYPHLWFWVHRKWR